MELRRRRVDRTGRWSALTLALGLLLGGCGDTLESTRRPDAAPPTPSDALPDAPGALPDAEPDAAGAADGPALKGPPYPFVLAHGFFGFDTIGPVEYFWKVKPALEKAGHVVEITTVDPFNSTYVRGEQLLAKVKAILAKRGVARVNIIGHSHGGIDARYVAYKLPGRVASVTTVATPHRGSVMAEELYKVKGLFTNALAKAFIAAVAPKLWGDPAAETNLKASMTFLRPSSMAAFNQTYTDRPGVSYFSIGGRSRRDLAPAVCAHAGAPAFIAKYAAVKDPLDPLLVVTSAFLTGSPHDPVPNDGIVRTAGTRWGTWLGCIPADHMDQVGQLLGDSPGKGNSFDHIAFYVDLANWLAAKGF